MKSIEGYGAVILGSAVYMGRWMSEAKVFAERFETQLAAVPVWLFSSGPLGDDVTPPAADPAGLHALKEQTHAREHRVFAGSLNRAELGMGERMVTRMVHAPEGDYRDWAAIHAWAREIAAALSVPTS